MKLKQYEVVTRPEFLSEPVGDIVRRYRTIKKYAYILHDKEVDVGTSPHYHIYLNFGKSGVDSKLVAEWFGLQESQVNRIQGRATDMLEYLTHSNASQKHKYQYSPSEVISNFDFEEEIRQSKIVGNFKEYSYAQQLQYIDTLPVSDKVTQYGKLKKLWEMHCKLLTLTPDRDIDVMFVQGRAGFGKTYFAKTFAERQHYDVCISSASNDPWQDYLGQKCMILDDFRDNTLDNDDSKSFTALLKMIDPFTSSTVQGRFQNKVFAGELIIITSSVPLSYWFKYFQAYKREDLQQLYRRFSYYAVVYENYIEVYTALDERGRPSGPCKILKNEVPSLKSRPRKKDRNLDDAFDKHFSTIPLDDWLEDKEKNGGG